MYYISRLRVPSEKAHSFQVVKMCQAYAGEGFEVTLVVPNRVNAIVQDIYAYYDVPQNFKCIFVPVPNLIKNAWWGRIGFWIEGLLFLWYSRSFMIERDSIIVSRSVEVSLFFSLRNYPYAVYEMHDLPKSCVGLYVSLLRKIKSIVVTSQGLYDVCKEHNLKCIIAHNGVDDTFFGKTDIYSRNDYGIPVDKKIVMYIGSLQGWKGVDTLLKASKNFSKNIQAVIIGGSLGEVDMLKKEYPNVIFLGQHPTKDLAYIQQLADILVVPNSTTEAVSTRFTSPIKLFAHLTSRKPIIVSRIPSIESLVTDSEVFFFDGSVQDLIEKVNLVANMSPCEYEDKTDIAFILSKNFTWQSRAKKIVEYVTR